MLAATRLKQPVRQLQAWLSGKLISTCPRDRQEVASASAVKAYRTKLAIACAVIFMIATSVRLLHWQDSHLQTGQESLTHRYLQHAQQMLDGEGILLPRDYGNPVNVQLLVHPPGYSIFVAAIFGLFGNSNDSLILAQIFADGASAVMVILIASQLLSFPAAAIAGLLVAFSPHLSRYSLFLLPDSLAALPILIAIYFFILSVKRGRLTTIIAAGCFIGLSCWLRANAELLVVFLALATLYLFERGRRLRYAAALVGATIVTISPITIRNALLFHRFIPLSLGAGITLIEGIGIHDVENRFGMPRNDSEAQVKDAEWHNRPDYLDGRWKPDGIERDEYRFRRGLEVIRSNPVWFGGLMVTHAGLMLSYNSPVSKGFPADTAHVPVVAAEATFGHQLGLPAEAEPSWSNSSEEFIASGKQLSPSAQIWLSADHQLLEVTGDSSEYADQFASAPIVVEKNTDYVLRLSARLVQGLAAVKVTSIDRRIGLASLPIGVPEKKNKRKKNLDPDDESSNAVDNTNQVMNVENSSTSVLDVPFATGNRTEVLLVISNNGASPVRATVDIARAELYQVGPTPNVWTRVIRPAIRGMQRNLYNTTTILPMLLIGITLLALAKRKGALLILLVVPVYYLVVQSAFHTEYRYILTIHYFLFIFAAVTIYVTGLIIGEGARWGKRTIARRPPGKGISSPSQIE